VSTRSPFRGVYQNVVAACGGSLIRRIEQADFQHYFAKFGLVLSAKHSHTTHVLSAATIHYRHHPLTVLRWQWCGSVLISDRTKYKWRFPVEFRL